MGSSGGCRLGIAAAALGVVLGGGGCGGAGTLTGSGGAGGGGVILGGGGSGVLTGVGGGMNCAEIPSQAARLPPDIMIVLDTSASMNDPIDGGGSKWSAVATAIGSVVEARSRMASWGLALMSSPSGACDAGSIAVPLSLGSGYIASALSARTNGDALVAAGNRPMRAALNLAAAHLSARNPGPHHVILLITDGLPNCIPGIVDVLSDDSQGALDAVTNAVIDGVTTAVVGLGIGAGPADTTLTNLAIAGGLGRSAAPVYYPASSSGDVAAAMNALLDDAYTCTFFVPEPPTTDGTTSRSLIQVRVGGTYVPQDPLNGWTYTDESQFGIDLHGSACDAAINGAAGAVTIVFPCYLQ